jgi:DNA-binding CsgD family transcriptional regulator/tetratricopeptide (TPR) repeat protein
MPQREVRDRRGRAERGGSGLLERETALAAIDHAIDATKTGAGDALLLEAHPGMGKTRLHEASLDKGRQRKLRVLRAAGAELEQNLAFGVAGQLLRGLIDELPAREPSSNDRVAASHGLFSVLADAVESNAALLAIDDLHWCDSASLEFLLYVLHRLEELPIAVVMTRRPGVGEEVIDRISAHPRVRIERLAPLGPEAVGELVARSLGSRADEGVIEACHEVTAGNPFYVRELLLALAEDPSLGGQVLARQARGLAPDAVTRAVRVRVGRLGPQAAALARAVAILGDDAPLRRAAALADLEINQASAAADALGAVEVLLAREPLRFVHPLVRHAVEDDVPASERAGQHLAAARLLEAEGASAEQVAAHLLMGRAVGDPWAVERLRAAARAASARAAWQSAARYLERALEEPPGAAEREVVLAELGTAEAAVGSPKAAEHLAQAAAASPDARRRAELALRRGSALNAQGMREQAAQAYEEGLREQPRDSEDPQDLELRDQLHAGFVLAAAVVPSLQARAIELSGKVLERASDGPCTQGQRLCLAQAAMHGALTGEPADSVSALAGRAWDGGNMLREANPQWIGWRIAAAAMGLSGELERAIEIIDAALEDARRRAWPLAFATASYVRGLPHLWQGKVGDALADLELARDARRYGWREFVRAAAAHCSLCLIERGQPDGAEEVLTEDVPLGEPQDLEDGLRMYALSEVRLAQGRAEEALEIALATGAFVEKTVEFFGYAPWRTMAAQAALALGDRERALELAGQAAARADRTGVLHQRIRTLRVLGMCEGGAAGMKSLRAAVRLGSTAPPRLETIRALVELGAALRRANKRAEARKPLQEAADLARRGGALALYEKARTELAATGARPRREAFLSGPESLTPSERRIADLAAAGQSNREIGQTLFVTPKTVEYHLRNTYRKLDIETRAELAPALAEPATT